MKRISYHLKESQIKSLKDFSRKTGLKIAEIIRQAIDKFLLEKK